MNRSGETVLVIGVDYIIREEIPWTDAVENILSGKMTPFKVHETKRLRSAGGTVDMAWPLIVRLNYWRDAPPKKKRSLNSRASSKEILIRDRRTCAYCGDLATTVDHIKPESWCKKDGDAENGWTWGNLVAACKPCNQKKADRTPEMAGMVPRWAPYVMDTKRNWVREQEEIWQILEEGGGFIEEAVNYEGILMESSASSRR